MATSLTDLELLARLISFAPVSSRSNRPIAEFIAGQLERAGAQIDLIESEDGKDVNVVARIGPSNEARAGLTLSGHLDVVPADEPDWTGDPFTMRQSGGCAFGRGACDMLGAAAVFANLFQSIDAGQLAAPLCLVLTYGEELGSLGAQRLAAAWPDAQRLPRACIVGEPTSLRAVRMHKGHLKLRVTVSGRSAHSGSPHLGRNAIETATPMLTALSKLREELERERPATGDDFDKVPFVALNIARLRGGDALNVIPDSCVIEIGLRPLPGMDSTELIDRVSSRVESADVSDSAEVAVINDNPPMLTPDDVPVYRVLCSVLDQRESIGVSYSSDGGVFGRDLGMECVLFGPGSIEDAHRPDEFVPIDELHRARDVLGKLIGRLCMKRVGVA